MRKRIYLNKGDISLPVQSQKTPASADEKAETLRVYDKVHDRYYLSIGHYFKENGALYHRESRQTLREMVLSELYKENLQKEEYALILDKPAPGTKLPVSVHVFKYEAMRDFFARADRRKVPTTNGLSHKNKYNDY